MRFWRDDDWLLILLWRHGSLILGKHRLYAPRNGHAANDCLILVLSDVVPNGTLLHRAHLSGSRQPTGAPRLAGRRDARGRTYRLALAPVYPERDLLCKRQLLPASKTNPFTEPKAIATITGDSD
jgi:hypothetical protein